MLRTLAAAVIAALALTAPAAQAGQPVQIGTGDAFDVMVDQDGRTTHAVWRDTSADPPVTVYCQLPAGAMDCALRTRVPTTGLNDGEVPRLVQGDQPGELFGVFPRYVEDDTWMVRSTDSGATWADPVKVYANGGWGGMVARTLVGGELVSAGTNYNTQVYGARPDGSEHNAGDMALLEEYDWDCGLGGGAHAAEAPDGGLLLTAPCSEGLLLWHVAPGADPSVTASYGQPAVLASAAEDQDYPRLFAGGGATFLGTSKFWHDRGQLRRITDAGTAEPPVEVPVAAHAWSAAADGRVGAVQERRGDLFVALRGAGAQEFGPAYRAVTGVGNERGLALALVDGAGDRVFWEDDGQGGPIHMADLSSMEPTVPPPPPDPPVDDDTTSPQLATELRVARRGVAVRRKRRHLRVRVRATVADATTGQAAVPCSGELTVTLWRRGRLLASKVVDVPSSCEGKLTLRVRRRHRNRAVTMVVQYGGSERLQAASAARRVRLR